MAWVALGVGQLVAGIGRPQGSPVAAVGSAAIDQTPPPVKNFAISAFGSHDKTVLIIGILVVLAVLSAIIGVAAMRSLRYGYLGLAIFAVIGLAAALTRPNASGWDVLPTLIGALAGAYALALLVRAAGGRAPRPLAAAGAGQPDRPQPAARARSGPPPGDPARAPWQPGRRSFLTAGVVALAAGGVGTLAGRSLSERSSVSAALSTIRFPKAAHPVPPLPGGVDLGIKGLSPFITPNSSFYRVDTALILPQVAPQSWTLRIHGMVEREITIDFHELLKRPLTEDYITLCCVSNPVAGPYIGNAKWLGASLASLLREARPRAGAEQLLCTSADGFTSGTPLATVMDGRDALLAVAMNGAPLPVAHGFPARMVVPGLYGYVSATKWVTDIKVTTFRGESRLLGAARLVAAGPDQDRVPHRRAGRIGVRGPDAGGGGGLGPAQGDRRGARPGGPWPVAAGPAGRRPRDRHLAAVGLGVGRDARHPRDRGPRHRRDGLHADRAAGATRAQRGVRLPERHGLRQLTFFFRNENRPRYSPRPG